MSKIALRTCLLLVGGLVSVSALPQAQTGPIASEFSLSGTWAPYFHEDLLERGNGPELDNYV